MKSVVRLCAAVVLAVAVCQGEGAELSASVPKGWGEDFAAAKLQAAKEGKFVFLAFSGSDWCGWCVKLDREVYSQQAFVAEAGKQFVLTMVDTPRDQKILSQLARAQNRPLVRKFGVRGFPAGVVCDSDGTEIGRIGGYVKGGPAAYLERMRELVKGRTPKPAAAAKTPQAKPEAVTSATPKRAR